MQKCMICQSGRDTVSRGGVTLCRRCLTVIHTVMLPKIRQNNINQEKKPKAD